jgi:hypothetical protein
MKRKNVPGKVVLPDGLIKVSSRVTPAEARYIAARLRGNSQTESARIAGMGPGLISHPAERIETGKVKRLLEECQALAVERALVKGLVDVEELHEHLSEQIRGDMADLYGETGELLPVKDWPRWARTGGVVGLDSEPVMERSKDGGDASWDDTGAKKVKIRFAGRVERERLLAQLKPVDALAAEKRDVDVTVTAVEEALRGANRRLQRLDARAIDTQADTQAVVIPEGDST